MNIIRGMSEWNMGRNDKIEGCLMSFDISAVICYKLFFIKIHCTIRG